MQPVAVKDANILIDCVELSLLEQVLKLSITFKIPDFVWAEIEVPSQREVIQPLIELGSLEVISFSPAEIEGILSISDAHSGISFEDSSALFLAKALSAILLTGDKKLRKVGQKTGVEVHGILWLLDQLFAEGMISPTTACEKIRLLNKVNPRLPSAAIQDRMKIWCA